MLTLTDFCTALWDSALGHVSCNEENDDGDEDSEIVVCTVCVWVGGLVTGCVNLFFGFLFYLFFHYQSVQLEKMGDNRFSQKV